MLGLSGTLIKNLPLSQRQAYRQDYMSRYKNKNYNQQNACVIVIQYKMNLIPYQKIFILKKDSSWQAFQNYINKNILKIGQSQSVTYSTTKKKTMINVNFKTIGSIYDNYRDPDDQMIYLTVLNHNSMG